jgi:hypothetical protein
MDTMDGYKKIILFVIKSASTTIKNFPQHGYFLTKPCNIEPARAYAKTRHVPLGTPLLLAALRGHPLGSPE